MSDKQDLIDETDVLRHMDNNACRIEMGSSIQKRFYHMQKLFQKTQVLSEKDFENAFTTFESVLETLNKKKPLEDEKDKVAKNKVTKLVTSN